ncbi:hypothetical protein KIN20_026376 [Parelaphostrongylus tenuis]|uniref:Uncharacterized protein n=1 Tax=Parelaphostrongylus tenuis TaxID=148309 RepID=A0AAD5QXZ4_PARTN|nr:hypothetical protein KIN20_026376 [Parelaphostrongylus tenuis]
MDKFLTFTILLLLSSTAESREPLDEDFEATLSDKEDDVEVDQHYENDLLVIANRFPEELIFFCNPRNELMRDRICYGQLDAYALACADDTPPLHLVPFCFAFKHQCSRITYPSDDWCVREFDRYVDYCTRMRRNTCKSCDYDLSCYCEPYECVWRRFGYNTAVWCQRYELFLRRERATTCMHLFNLPKVICDPFRRQFDYNRCTKFLFDCELISNFDDELGISEKQIVPEEAHHEGEEAPKKTLTLTPEDKEIQAEIAQEEVELERLTQGKGKRKRNTRCFFKRPFNENLLQNSPQLSIKQSDEKLVQKTSSVDSAAAVETQKTPGVGSATPVGKQKSSNVDSVAAVEKPSIKSGIQSDKPRNIYISTTNRRSTPLVTLRSSVLDRTRRSPPENRFDLLELLRGR